MASGWNLRVWLQCIGVVSGCCCKEVYRYPHNIFRYSTCISSFFGSSIPTSLFIFKMFFRSLIILVKDNLQTKDEWLVPNLSIVWRFDCTPTSC